MELITILNRCHRFRGFVYQHAHFSADKKSIEVAVRPRNRTERSNAGTNRSRESASGRERRCRWTMHGVWCKATSSITTTPSEQRGWLHHAKGHARRASAGDPCREGPEVGGAKAAADWSAAGCVIAFGATLREAHYRSQSSAE